MFQWPSLEEMMPFIIAIVLIVADIIILKIGLAITKAEDRTNFKWVAGSFGIQFGIIFFFSLPLLFMGFRGAFGAGGPDPAVMVPTIIFSAFIDLNIINVIHKLGMKRSIIIVLLTLGPLIVAMYIINSNLGYFLFAS
jgi:hypothetical protein